MVIRSSLLLTAFVITVATSSPGAQAPATAALDAEPMQHFQALMRLDTSSPPGNEIRVVE